MFLSDQSHHNGRGPGGWKPLSPEHLERGGGPGEAFSKAPKGDAGTEFRHLYTAEKRPGAAEDFRLMVSALKSPESDAGRGGDGTSASGPTAAAGKTAVVPTIEQEAYEKGYAKGEKEGLAAGEKQVQVIVGQMQTILAEIQILRQRMVEKYESEILNLLCRAVEKVVYGQVELDNEIVKRAILDTFEMIPELDDVTISVNPEDYEHIDVLREEVFEQVKDLKNVNIIANPAVGRGGCKVEARSGEVDATIDSRLDAITKSIMNAGGHTVHEE